MPNAAGLYLRESQDRAGDELAVSRQRQDGVGLIDRRGWSLVDEYCDNAVSAAGRKARPQFERLLADVIDGRIDVIVSWALDRLTRDRRSTIRLIEACQQHGAMIALVRGTDIDLSTPSGRLFAGLLSEIAQGEIDTKGDRQRRAALQAAEGGKRWAGPRPFGYEADGVTVRSDEANAISRACDDLLAGAKIGTVIRDLNAAGHRTVFGGEWTFTSTVRMLCRPRNAGLRDYRGEVIGPAVWPAIVPEATWRATVALLTDPSRRHSAPGAKLLLTSIASCQCSDPIHGGQATRGRHQTYRCNRRGGYEGPHISTKAEPVDDFVGDVVVARLSRPDAADLLVDDQRPDFADLRTQAAAIRARLREIGAAFGAGEMDRMQSKTATERARADLAAVEKRMEDASRMRALGPLVRARDAEAAWREMDIDRRRTVVSALFETITLRAPGRGRRPFDPANVELVWARE